MILLAVGLALLLLVVALPFGMGHMADCPACTHAEHPFALGLCLGILSLLSPALTMYASRLRLSDQIVRRLLLTPSIYRPPRFS